MKLFQHSLARHGNRQASQDLKIDIFLGGLWRHLLDVTLQE
jgi:hypothetical protein